MYRRRSQVAGMANLLGTTRTARAVLTVQAPLIAAAPAVARVPLTALYAARNHLPAQRRLLRSLARGRVSAVCFGCSETRTRARR